MVKVILQNENEQKEFDLGNEKTFKTGSRGYQSTGIAVINGKSYRANFLLVEQGSKPKPSVQEPPTTAPYPTTV